MAEWRLWDAYKMLMRRRGYAEGAISLDEIVRYFDGGLSHEHLIGVADVFDRIDRVIREHFEKKSAETGRRSRESVPSQQPRAMPWRSQTSR